MSINRVTLSGNLTRNPDLRQTPAGTEILTFGIAVNERVKNQSTGEWEDRPNFVDCVVFGRRADSLSRILGKGMKVALDGKLRYNSWTDKDNHRRSKLEVIVDEIDIMRSKNDGDGYRGNGNQNAGAYSGGYGNSSQNASQGRTADVYDDDVPF